MIAVAACAVITLGLTIFAFQTKIDFTMIGGGSLFFQEETSLHLSHYFSEIGW